VTIKPSDHRRSIKRFKAQIKALKHLVKHSWIHSGYPDCGLMQMGNKEKRLYLRTIGRPKNEWPEWLLEKDV
jgi:hypothetical protein